MSMLLNQSTAPVTRPDRRNYWVYLWDGGIWMLGMSFIEMSLVVPQMAHIFLDEQMGSYFVNSLPIFALVTFVGSLLTASLTERLREQKKVVLAMAFFQRIPFLFAGLALLVFGAEYPVEAFWFAMAMLMVFFFFSGLVTNPWNELFLKTFSIDKRSSMVGQRLLLGQILTITIGWTVLNFLMPSDANDKVAAAHSFGQLFLVTAIFALISLWFVTKMVEPVAPVRTKSRSGMFGYIKRMPHVLRQDLYFGKYLMIAVLGLAWIPVMPNFSLYVTRVLDKGPDYAGFLVGVMAAGSMVGNVLAGRMGDARGGRYCLLWGRGVIVAVIAGFLVLPPTEITFTVLTALMAAAIQVVCVGDFAYLTEMAPEDERPSYLSLYRLLLVPVMIAGIGVGLLWANLHLATELVLMFGGMSMAFCWWMTLALPEPREEKALIDRARRSPDSIRMTILKPIFPNFNNIWRRGA